MSDTKLNGSANSMVAHRDLPITDEKRHHSEQPGSPTHDSSFNPGAHIPKEVLFREAHIPLWRWGFLCVGICLGLFMAMIDSSIVATSLYTIGKEFNDLESINWIALAYTLAFLGCSVFFARMADVVGRRNAFIAAFIIFFSFSLGCGFSHNMTTLIVCRAFQGIGGSGLFSVTMVIFPEITPPQFKTRIASIIGATISMGGVLGPILGGVFTEYATWRWVFWINVPIGFVALVLFGFAWPKDEHLPNLEKRSWKDLDFVGSFLVIAAAVLVTFAFQNAGVNSSGKPWAKAIFIAPFVIGVFCWVGLAVWQHFLVRRSPRKMAALPPTLIRNRVFAAAALNTIFLGFAFLATLYTVPLRLQVVNGKSPIMAGVIMLPMIGATGLGSVIMGVFSRKENRLSETIIVAAVMMTLGLALETMVPDSSELDAKFIGFMVFIGLGYGMSTATSTMFTVGESSIAEHAPAQGLIAQCRMLGGSIGIAMSSAVLAAQEKAQLAGIVPSTALADLQAANLTEAQYAVVRKTYNDAFTETMTVCAIVAGIAILLSMGTYSRDRVPLMEQRKQQVQAEIARRIAMNRPRDAQPAGLQSSTQAA